MKKITSVVAVGLLLGLGYGIWHEMQTDMIPHDSATSENITTLFPAKQLPELQFVNQDGQLIKTDDLSGKWHLMFLGYTHCPDICPILLKNMESVMPALKAYPIDFIFASADPQHDSPEVMRQYLQQFSHEFIGLTSDESNLQTLIETLGVFVTTGEDGKIDHQGVLFIINPDKQIVALINSPNNPEQIVADIEKTLKNLA